MSGISVAGASSLRRQVRQVREGGFPVVMRKARIFARILPDLPGFFLGLLIVLVVRLLRPLIVVRFCHIRSEKIGHCVPEMEVYLSERALGLHDPKWFDIFYHSSRPGTLPFCNSQVKLMLDRAVRINAFARWPDWINRRIPGGRIHAIQKPICRDVHGYFSQTPAQLSLTAEEERRGRQALEAMGVGEDTPFICFIARDSTFLDTLHPGVDWHYHDYRDSPIIGQLPAVEQMTRRGYTAFRMGAIVSEPLETTNPKIIDYATKFRTEFLDIYLTAKCRFFIGTGTGLDCVAFVSRRPMASVNFAPLEDAPTWGEDDVYIAKKYWLRKEERFMTFREIIQSGAGRFHQTEEFNQFGITMVDNTAEEITALVTEMDDRLNGTWVGAPGDDELQERYWSLFTPDDFNGVFRSRIGAEFLRQNRELLV